MTTRVTLPELPRAIMEILDEYDREVAEATPQSVRKTANKCKRMIQTSAAANFGGSDYKKSWSVKTANSSPHEFSVVVYSKMPGLPHLLENGHVKKNRNGKVLGRTGGRAHIKPAELKAIAELMKEIRRSL